ncbi:MULTISPECIES: phospholipase D-like domain-containing protein [unclassified Pseudomonas]
MLISNFDSNNNHMSHTKKLLEECKDHFIIASPFLASNMSEFLKNFNFSNLNTIELITTLRPYSEEQLTKPYQIITFYNFFSQNHPKIKLNIHISNKLHGKIYLSKSQKTMILTSANFTNNGLVSNHEWGFLTKDETIINKTATELFHHIEYKELTLHQLLKACMFSEQYKKLNPEWVTLPDISCDILKSIYSDTSANNTTTQYFLKPIGHSERPVTLNDQQDFSGLHQNLHFSKKKPKGLRKGDIIITTAVGAGSILSYFRITGGLQYVADAQVKIEPWVQRWPWYLEGRNHSPKFGGSWWIHDLKRQDLLDEFRQIHPNTAITNAGGFSLGTINMGSDKVKITKEFGEFLIEKINSIEKQLNSEPYLQHEN